MDKTIISKYIPYFRTFFLLVLIMVHGIPVFAGEGDGGSLATSLLNSENIVTKMTLNNDQQLQGLDFLYSGVSDTDVNRHGRGYRWAGPPPEMPDWRGIKWDTTYFITYQFVVIGVLYAAPESLSGWTKEDKEEYSLQRWVENVTNPVWDKDKWWVNYILHPYWGGTYYIRGRERGFARLSSFWYAVLLSSLYEYGAEALFEPVSYQDLVVTPVVGALVGEFLFTPIRKWVRAKPGQLNLIDKTVLLLTDPIGVISEETSRILGVNTTVSLGPLKTEPFPRASWNTGLTEISLPDPKWNNHVWGIQFKISL